MAHTFCTPTSWLEDRLNVLVLGAGGTGGEVLYALARMHTMLVQLGHPGGLSVTVMDADRVSRANIGRQRFAACDIGQLKSDVLVHRLNLFFGLDWQSIPEHWTTRAHPRMRDLDLVISCVDRAAVRVELGRALREHHEALLWMDFGNGEHTGQCVLGHPAAQSRGLRLPTVLDLYPELVTVKDQNTPSCSAAEAVRQQDLFVNALLAESGISLLWKLLRHGSTQTHGVLMDVREPSVESIPIDESTWQMYGYTAPAHARRNRKTL